MRHIATLPTEEIFTTPDPTRTEGKVRASRPLALGGALVEGLELRFEGGRISDVSATRGAEVVRAQLAIDDGAARLGEVALVDDTSPIQQSGVLFYDTLWTRARPRTWPGATASLTVTATTSRPGPRR